MLFLYIFIFIFSCGLLFLAGKLLIKNLLHMAHFLGWREFVVAFIAMAFAASVPNLFLGITSAIHGKPQLSFSDVMGGNLIDLTLVIALAVLFSKNNLPAQSRMIQISAIFTVIIAILPFFLILDNVLSRGDALILLFVFGYYIFWTFSKKERFTKIYDNNGKNNVIEDFSNFLKSVGKIILGILLLALASEGMVRSSLYFVDYFKMPLILVGLLVVSLGNSIPEGYFTIISAKKGMNWLILGDLMGAIIVPATLVLAVAALIHPIEIYDFSPFFIARFFFIISALLFLFFVRTGRKITKKEAFFLLGIYIIFVCAELLKNYF